MEKDKLTSIARKIASQVNVDKIYCLFGQENSVQSDHLVLLMPSSDGAKFTEIQPFVRMAIAVEENITFEMFHTSEAKTALKEGNLFFHLICRDENLLYNKQNGPILPVSTAQELLNWKNAAIERFKDGVDKTTAFLEGAEFYRERHETGLTVFMLHQVAELTYRALELCILTKEKRTHNIKAHQKYLTPFIPQIGILFPDDTPEEKDILKTLENAYSAVRYDQNHTVKAEHIPVLFERITRLQERSKVIVIELGNMLDEKRNNAINTSQAIIEPDNIPVTESLPSIVSETETPPLESNQLKEIIALIVEHLSPDQIYLFGNIIRHSEKASLFGLDKNGQKENIHFDLLVISSAPNPYNNIHSLINLEPDNTTINILVHTRDEALRKLQGESNDTRNRFFETVFRDGKLLYSKTVVFDKTKLRPDNHFIHASAAPNINTRIERSIAFLKAAKEVKDEINEVTISLLAQGIEQSCLGLIYAFWGYIPNIHNLSHLLNICKVFWPEGEYFLPRQTDWDKHLFRLLSNIYSSVRFSVDVKMEPEEFTALYARCTDFIEMAESQALEEVEVLGYHPISEAQNVKFNVSI